MLMEKWLAAKRIIELRTSYLRYGALQERARWRPKE
jgi:hypothetical protein